MTGCHEHNSSPSITGRGGDGADQWSTHQLSRSFRKSTFDRWNFWARRPYASATCKVASQRANDFLRQGFGCDRSREKNQRPSFENCARQFCADGSIRGARIGGRYFVGSGYQFSTGGRSTSRIFLSQGWPARYAHEHGSRFDGSRMVGAGITRGHHARD